MRTATKVSAYGLALAIVFGGAWVAGAAVGPVSDSAPPSEASHSGGHDAAAAQPVDTRLPGLALADNGYRLELSQTTVPTGSAEQFRFRILGPEDAAITGFDVEHEKRLHLVLVRRDGTGYQHLHPEMVPDGTWSVPLTLPAAGSYRVFADFKPTGGVKTTLGADIQVPGQFEPTQHDSPIQTSTVDGYQVTLDGNLTPGKSSTVTATVTRNGQQVTDLQPYLGAYGHLVALRATDLGYLHVHPLGEPGDGTTTAGPKVQFAVEVPTTGRYRLFLDFQHEGRVRTAEFTVDTHEEGHR
ncbi:hypothetical protein KIPE111705_05220 [Kibdelosporangium persicum]|uniref:Heavy metal-associated domain-containing secreted protein n=1 Tax=Kibdelosporangium persicum TaxID=2698649 RepID=A0ABX2FE99_9PSEU|nr:hypothetical protein [Kibdelosporangium persicum]NRN69151.1 Heavy metal-associated domain-containing secreted protein [Kibdelosporangium persicum]